LGVGSDLIFPKAGFVVQRRSQCSHRKLGAALSGRSPEAYAYITPLRRNCGRTAIACLSTRWPVARIAIFCVNHARFGHQSCPDRPPPCNPFGFRALASRAQGRTGSRQLRVLQCVISQAERENYRFSCQWPLIPFFCSIKVIGISYEV
jgi:hypothetical protein